MILVVNVDVANVLDTVDIVVVDVLVNATIIAAISMAKSRRPSEHKHK